MTVEATIKKIGGSTFALLPPDLVRDLGLAADQKVLIEIRKVGGSGKDLMKLYGKYPDLPRFDRQALWGNYGER